MEGHALQVNVLQWKHASALCALHPLLVGCNECRLISHRNFVDQMLLVSISV